MAFVQRLQALGQKAWFAKFMRVGAMVVVGLVVIVAVRMMPSGGDADYPFDAATANRMAAYHFEALIVGESLTDMDAAKLQRIHNGYQDLAEQSVGHPEHAVFAGYLEVLDAALVGASDASELHQPTGAGLPPTIAAAQARLDELLALVDSANGIADERAPYPGLPDGRDVATQARQLAVAQAEILGVLAESSTPGSSFFLQSTGANVTAEQAKLRGSTWFGLPDGGLSPPGYPRLLGETGGSTSQDAVAYWVWAQASRGQSVSVEARVDRAGVTFCGKAASQSFCPQGTVGNLVATYRPDDAAQDITLVPGIDGGLALRNGGAEYFDHVELRVDGSRANGTLDGVGPYTVVSTPFLSDLPDGIVMVRAFVDGREVAARPALASSGDLLFA
jgi:hypothetical protein